MFLSRHYHVSTGIFFVSLISFPQWLLIASFWVPDDYFHMFNEETYLILLLTFWRQCLSLYLRQGLNSQPSYLRLQSAVYYILWSFTSITIRFSNAPLPLFLFMFSQSPFYFHVNCTGNVLGELIGEIIFFLNWKPFWGWIQFSGLASALYYPMLAFIYILHLMNPPVTRNCESIYVLIFNFNYVY